MKSIRRHLYISTIAIIALPLFFVAVINSFIALSEMQNEMLEDNRQIINETKFLLNSYLNLILTPLKNISTYIPEANDIPASVRAALSWLLIQSEYYQAVHFFSKDGTLLASIPENSPPAALVLFTETAEQPVWTIVENTELNAVLAVFIVFDNYIIEGLINLNILEPAIHKAVYSSSTEVYLINENGYFLTSSLCGQKYSGSSLSEKVTKKIYNGGAVFTIDKNLVFTAADILTPANIHIYAVSNVPVYFSSLPHSIIKVFACMIFLAIFFFFIFVIEFNRNFQKSIYNLLSDIQTFAECNEFPQKMEPLYRELIPLTEAFNRMGDAIHIRENRIKEDLKEKEILLREIHHRVKNNLQIIYSLLNLQEVYLYDVRDRVFFEKTKQRIQSIALVHDKLYHSDNMSEIDICEYTRTLVSELNIPKNITVIVLENKTIISLKQAIPCALIILELLTNAVNHAFPGKTEKTVQIPAVNLKESSCSVETGGLIVNETLRVTASNTETICINIANDENMITITVQDNGLGMPEENYPRGMGLVLVKTLCRQLKAVFQIKNNKGTTGSLHFRL